MNALQYKGLLNISITGSNHQSVAIGLLSPSAKPSTSIDWMVRTDREKPCVALRE